MPTTTPQSTTINGHPLSGNVTVTKSDVGLSNVPNTDCTTTANISDSTGKRFVADADLTKLANTSGVNTGDQDISGKADKSVTINGHGLGASFDLTPSDIGAPSGSGTSSGTNTGDQTSVSGNAGTATALATPRNINGVAFDGTADITIPSGSPTLDVLTADPGSPSDGEPWVFQYSAVDGQIMGALGMTYTAGSLDRYELRIKTTDGTKRVEMTA